MKAEEKKLAKELAEEAVHSAKGHFKTSDWIGRQLFVLVLVPFITSALCLVFNFPPAVVRFLSFLGLVFSVLALVYAYASNQDKAREDMKKHMILGNNYLEVYKRLREGVRLDALSQNELNKITKKISALDNKSNDLKISLFGRWHTKYCIKKELDMTWLNKN